MFDRPFAEREGFEPPDLLQSTVFKTAALNRSAISPAQKYILKFYPRKKLMIKWLLLILKIYNLQ